MRRKNAEEEGREGIGENEELHSTGKDVLRERQYHLVVTTRTIETWFTKETHLTWIHMCESALRM